MCCFVQFQVNLEVPLPGSGCCLCIPWMLVQQIVDKAAAVFL